MNKHLFTFLRKLHSHPCSDLFSGQISLQPRSQSAPIYPSEFLKKTFHFFSIGKAMKNTLLYPLSLNEGSNFNFNSFPIAAGSFRQKFINNSPFFVQYPSDFDRSKAQHLKLSIVPFGPAGFQV
jgi:hypothetical protein